VGHEREAINAYRILVRRSQGKASVGGRILLKWEV
jgi:hypothetical protein